MRIFIHKTTDEIMTALDGQSVLEVLINSPSWEEITEADVITVETDGTMTMPDGTVIDEADETKNSLESGQEQAAAEVKTKAKK